MPVDKPSNPPAPAAPSPRATPPVPRPDAGNQHTSDSAGSSNTLGDGRTAGGNAGIERRKQLDR